MPSQINLRNRILQYFRVEFEDFGRLRFHAGMDWHTEMDNYHIAKEAYQEITMEFSELVDELSDGIAIDRSRLETLGMWLWFSLQYMLEFRKIV